MANHHDEISELLRNFQRDILAIAANSLAEMLGEVQEKPPARVVRPKRVQARAAVEPGLAAPFPLPGQTVYEVPSLGKPHERNEAIRTTAMLRNIVYWRSRKVPWKAIGRHLSVHPRTLHRVLAEVDIASLNVASFNVAGLRG